MEALTRVLAEGLQKGNALLVIILLVMLAVMNAHKVYPLFVERKKSRLKNLDAALRSEWVQGMERECLKEQAATEHFYAATGILMEKAPRRAMLEIYQRSVGRLQFVHFKRAASYVCYEKGEFEIRIGRFERLMMWVGLGTGLPVFAVSVALFLWTLYMLLMFGSEPLGSWRSWLIFSVIGWASIMSSRSAYSANRIRKEANRQAGVEVVPDKAPTAQ